MGQRARFIPELLVTHAEELSFLWERRCRVLYSPLALVREIGDLAERMEAHVQGLRVAPDAALELLRPQLCDCGRGESFAAAYGILRGGAAGAAVVQDAFAAAKGESLNGIGDAMCMAHRVIDPDWLTVMVAQADAAVAVAAAGVLAAQARLDPALPRLATLLTDDDPAICAAAWRIVARADPVTCPVPRPFIEGMNHEQADVRSAAVGAALWRAEPWAVGGIRKIAQDGDEVGWQWLSAVGGASDLPQIAQAIGELKRGTGRLALAGRFGHPSLLPRVVDEMTTTDVATAASAGAVFARITGFNVQGWRATLPVGADADEFDREFAEQVWLPDATKASRLLQAHRQRWDAGVRWCQGREISTRLDRDSQLCIDLQSLWDFGARGALSGVRPFSLPCPG